MLPGFAPNMHMATATAKATPDLKGVTTASTPGASSLSIPVPAGAVVGDMLLIFETNTNGTVSVSQNTPAGFTQLVHTVGVGNLRRVGAYYKIVDGSEGANISLSISTGSVWSAICALVSCNDGTVDVSTPVSASSASPNPSAVSMTGVAETLVLAFVGMINGASASAAPSGYSNLNQKINTATSPNNSIAIATKQVTAASEDPGTFTFSASNAYVAATLAIR